MNRPFLSANELVETARSKVPVICSGVQGMLCVLRDGSVLFHADEVGSWCSHRLQLPAHCTFAATSGDIFGL